MLRAFVVALALVYAVPASMAYAQMDFGGLDLGGKKKKKKKKHETEEEKKPVAAASNASPETVASVV